MYLTLVYRCVVDVTIIWTRRGSQNERGNHRVAGAMDTAKLFMGNVFFNIVVVGGLVAQWIRHRPKEQYHKEDYRFYLFVITDQNVC